MSANAQKPNTPSTPPRKSYSEWDWQFSTYYWKIYLDPRHAGNNPNVIKLTGYSKKTNQRENPDADILLRRKIFSLCKKGYFQRMLRIEFYQKKGEMLNTDTAPLIITVYPDHYNIPEMNHDVIYKKHGKWLEDLFYRLKMKKDITDLMPTSKARTGNQDDFLNIHNYNFTSVASLYQHGTKCLHHGHAEGAVTHFIREYKALKQWP